MAFIMLNNVKMPTIVGILTFISMTIAIPTIGDIITFISMMITMPESLNLNMFKPSSIILLTVPGRCFFCGSFLLFVLVFAILACLFLTAL